MEHKQYILSLLFVVGSPAIAQDRELPAVQVGGKFYGYTEAAQAKGAKVSVNQDGSYTFSTTGKSYLVEANGNGLKAVSASLFPTSVLVSFTFKKTVGSGTTFVNDRGPIPSIKIDGNGNGEGNAYIDPKDGDQSIEVTYEKKSAKGVFTVKEKKKVLCEGKKKLSCTSS